MADFQTFLEIIESVERAISGQGASKRDLVKDMINMVYLNEVLEADDLYPLYWLHDWDDSYKSKAPAQTITGITPAAPPVVSDATHLFTVGDLITINSVVGMTELNGRTFKVGAIVAATSYSLHDLDGNAIAGATYTAWISGGRAIHAGITLATANKDVKRVLQAKWLDRYDTMTVATSEEIEDGNSPGGMGTTFFGMDDSDSATRPTRWMHLKRFNLTGDEINYLMWGPASDDVYPLRYWYEKRVDRLVGNMDVPLLPIPFHTLLSSGTIVRLAESNVQVDNQVVWPGIYRMGMAALLAFNRKYYTLNPKWAREKPYMM